MSAKDMFERMMLFEGAWESLCPHKQFGGMTLDEFKALVHPAHRARQRIDELGASLRVSYLQRDCADAAVSNAMRRVVCGVLADPEEGEDGELYEAMGYVPKSKRRTGCMRIRKGGAR